MLDELSRECLAIHLDRQMTAHDVLAAMPALFRQTGVNELISVCG